jgi:hypothetical protein
LTYIIVWCVVLLSVVYSVPLPRYVWRRPLVVCKFIRSAIYV